MWVGVPWRVGNVREFHSAWRVVSCSVCYAVVQVKQWWSNDVNAEAHIQLNLNLFRWLFSCLQYTESFDVNWLDIMNGVQLVKMCSTETSRKRWWLKWLCTCLCVRVSLSFDCSQTRALQVNFRRLKIRIR